MRLTILISFLLALVSTPLLAEENQSEMEPQVTIIKRGTDVIEEYRINGQLYKIKVTSKKGHGYFLIDTDGDGNFEIFRNDLGDNVLIPQWTLFSW